MISIISGFSYIKPAESVWLHRESGFLKTHNIEVCFSTHKSPIYDSRVKSVLADRQLQEHLQINGTQQLKAETKILLNITIPEESLAQPTSSPPPIQPAQPTSLPPPIQPVQPTSSPPIPTIPDTQPPHPPSPLISSPPYNEIEGPSFDPSYHMSPPPSHKPEIQTSRTSEEREGSAVGVVDGAWEARGGGVGEGESWVGVGAWVLGQDKGRVEWKLAGLVTVLWRSQMAGKIEGQKEDPMTEEDLQAEIQASKKSRE
ncbi:hypothetical protein Tco_1484963 [Tanacetum coccineum]